jgi:hypothetical protein
MGEAESPMECKTDKNRQNCTCSYETCSRKGNCCECVRYHRKNGELPACYFPEDIEATYDRTIERFAKVYLERGSWW